MSRPQKAALQRCFLFGSLTRGVEDAAPYKRELRFFDTLPGIKIPETGIETKQAFARL